MTHPPGSSSPADLTYYTLLGLSPTASEADVRRAYRQKSKLYHPDTTALPPEKAAEQFQQLKEAYATLTNAEARRRYDCQLRPVTQNIRRAPSSTQQSVPNIDSKQRPLSPGEVFALFLLGITFLACLVLALVVGTAQSEDWRAAQRPSEWVQPVVTWFQQRVSSAPKLPGEETRRPLELDHDTAAGLR